MTPAEFERNFKIDAKRLRAYLRNRWPLHIKNEPWNLDQTMVADACQHFDIPTSRATGLNPVHLANTPGVPLVSITSESRPNATTKSPRARAHRPEERFLSIAVAAGFPLVRGQALPWLNGRGHLNEVVQRAAPPHVVAALANLHRSLGGDASVLGSKAAGNAPKPDYVHTGLGCLVEIDERQHFTTARLQSFDFYPDDAVLGYDRDEYVRLVTQWRAKGDKAFAHKTAPDFPNLGGRQAQRAYNDALRDLIAPTFAGHPVIRIPVPDDSLRGTLDRLAAALDRLR